MLADPFLAFGPEIPFFHIKSLLSQLGSTRRHFLVRDTECTEDPIQNPKIKQHEDGSGNDPREHTLPWIHSVVPRRHHFAFPSNRNCAWSLAKIRGAAMSN